MIRVTIPFIVLGVFVVGFSAVELQLPCCFKLDVRPGALRAHPAVLLGLPMAAGADAVKLEPGITRLDEAISRLGKPSVDHVAYTVAIDPFLGPPSPAQVYALTCDPAGPGPILTVRLLAWETAGTARGIRAVFRDDRKLWYAVLPEPRSLKEIEVAEGARPKRAILEVGFTDVRWQAQVIGWPERGVAWVKIRDVVKVLFPPTDELPFRNAPRPCGGR